MRAAMAAAFAASIAVLVGCSGDASSAGSFAPDPDFASPDAQLSTPTGTLSAPVVDDGARALVALQSAELSIAALAHVTPSHTSCQALGHHDAAGTCACPGGGAFAYDFSALADAGEGVLRMHLDGCRAADLVLDGDAFAQQKSGAIGAVRAHVVATRDGRSTHLTMWTDAQPGAPTTLWARAEVTDGAILVWAPPPRGTKDDEAEANVVVKDRATTWTCSTVGTDQRCSSQDGKVHDAKV